MKITRRTLVPLMAGAGAVVANATFTVPPQASSQSGATPDAGSGSETTSYDLPGDGVYPEGVAFDQAAGTFYVGSAATGTIYRGDLATGEVTVFLEGADQGLISVTGLEVDEAGRLWVSGAATGLVAVYDTVDGALVGQAANGLEPGMTFINDVTVSSDGTGYFSDSMTPQLLIIRARDGQLGAPETVSFEGTVYEYGEGFNANGLQLTADEAHVIIIDSGTASLYRYTVDGGEISAIEIGDADLTGGDGLALDGDILYVCQNSVGQISRLRLNEDASTATFIDAFSDPAFAFPTTIALTDRDTVLVCNSQFDTRESSAPDLPFNVVEIAIPALPTDAATPVVEVGTGQDQDSDNATPGATPEV